MNYCRKNPVFIHKKGKLRYKHCFTFSLRPAEANCVPEKSLQRRSRYKPSWKEGQWPHHRGYVMCSWLADRKSRLSSTDTEVGWKLNICSQSFLQTSSSPRQLFNMVQRLGLGRERYLEWK
ncbi:hypothetical protein ILYODFUR_037087 [Ilyodon furcidens]|uniref:Uncharacterized protein n=1 Tax=Ilyodon furcidens TaxID=33524 RepID=A0ABV0TE61_9TELE